MRQAFACLLHLNAAPHGGLGRAPAGHSFHTGAPTSHPLTTQPPLGATWHPGPQDSLATDTPAPPETALSSTAQNISLIASLHSRRKRGAPACNREGLVLFPVDVITAPTEAAEVVARGHAFACDETPRGRHMAALFRA
jgi:hypothetical protein